MKTAEKQPVTLIGFASGLAGNDPDTGLAPWHLYQHPELFSGLQVDTVWGEIVVGTSAKSQLAVLPDLEEVLNDLTDAVGDHLEEGDAICVIGGDHSVAIGTWSAVANYYREEGDIGLIWIDAHLDGHTPETSPSKNIHGMPVSHLLGHGIESLCQLLDEEPKIKPEHICFIGVRSYEPGEQKLLTSLGVKIIYMDEVTQHGFANVFGQAIKHVSKGTCGFGLTIDMDGIDPVDAPGVGIREKGGILANDLLPTLKSLAHQYDFLGLELAEYNPLRDEDMKTAKLMAAIVEAVWSE